MKAMKVMEKKAVVVMKKGAMKAMKVMKKKKMMKAMKVMKKKKTQTQIAMRSFATCLQQAEKLKNSFLRARDRLWMLKQHPQYVSSFKEEAIIWKKRIENELSSINRVLESMDTSIGTSDSD